MDSLFEVGRTVGGVGVRILKSKAASVSDGRCEFGSSVRRLPARVPALPVFPFRTFSNQHLANLWNARRACRAELMNYNRRGGVGEFNGLAQLRSRKTGRQERRGLTESLLAE